MEDVWRVNPSLKKEIKKYGIFDEKGCYNCGTCTVVCSLSETSAFPRRPIQYAIIGLEDKLKRSLEPWLCHDCGDCSISCPQKANPQSSMEAIRRYLIAQYDWTGIAKVIYRSKVAYMFSIVGMFVLTILLIGIYHMFIDPDVRGTMSLKEFLSTPMGLSHMFPMILYFTLFVVLVPFAILLTNAFRMWWFTMKDEKIPLSVYLKALSTYFYHSVAHPNIRKCEEPIHKKRWLTHWMMAAGCVLMLFIIVFLLKWFQTDNIYPIYHPQRLLGYLATIGLLVGSGDALFERIRKKEEIYKTSDVRNYTLPALIFLIALSGILVHIFRYAGLELATHYAYGIHIAVTVPFLLIEMPFGKWTHMIYRPLAIYFERVKEIAGIIEVEEIKGAEEVA